MNDFLNVSLEKYREQIKILKKFSTDHQWNWTLEYDILLNPKLGNDIENFIKEFDLECLNIKNIEDIINKIKKESLVIMDKADKEDNIVKKWFLYRLSYAYYGFLEVVIEGSVLTNKIFEMFKEKYGDSYLEVLRKIDNINPSILTNFDKIEGNTIKGKEVELYLLMKKWQDIEHLYHCNDLIEKHDKAKEEFERYVHNKCPYLSGIKGRNLLGIYLLDCTPIINMEQIHKFFDINIEDKLVTVIGGKNLGLAKLKYHNVEIPEAFVIPVGAVINNSYEDELCKLPSRNYSVRSSATVEDNKNQSFAGLFVTKLNVSHDKLGKAIKEVHQSVSTERVVKYCEKFNTSKPYMSVVVQFFEEPQYSGVWLGNSLDTGHLEWVNGNGEKLVSGKVIPKYENWNQSVSNPLKVNNQIVAKKCIDLQHELNIISDFEWCVVDNKLKFVQFRPVTAKIISNNENQIDSENIVSGIPASSGTVTGKPHYLEDVEDINKFKKGEILLADFTDPDWVPAMIESSAIVTAEGGFLSHSAIISRELGIPCITGVGYDHIELLSKYSKITVNGNKGTITF